MGKLILNKLKETRKIIKQSDLKKSGRNEYSKFDYFTPEQIEALVDNACSKTNTITLCNLKKDEFGLYQTLDFIDLETEEKLSFEMRTKFGSITATNETQQMGGTDTYSERYIKMKVFQIKDNNLDFDGHKNKVESITDKINKCRTVDELKRVFVNLTPTQKKDKKILKMLGEVKQFIETDEIPIIK